MSDFSPELIERFIRHIKENYDVSMTEEEANEGLKNLAGLYIAFSKPNGRKK